MDPTWISILVHMPFTMLSDFLITFRNLMKLLLWLRKLHPRNRTDPHFGTLDVVSMCNPLERENPIWINMYPKEYSLDMVHIPPKICSIMMLIHIESGWPPNIYLTREWMTCTCHIILWMYKIFRESIMDNTFLKKKKCSCQLVWILYWSLHRPYSCAT